MKVVGCGQRKRVVVRVTVVVVRMKQAPKVSRYVAVAASEHADCHVLFQLNPGFRQHRLRYVGVQSRTGDAFLESPHHFVVERIVGIHRGVDKL